MRISVVHGAVCKVAPLGWSDTTRVLSAFYKASGVFQGASAKGLAVHGELNHWVLPPIAERQTLKAVPGYRFQPTVPFHLGLPRTCSSQQLVQCLMTEGVAAVETRTRQGNPLRG